MNSLPGNGAGVGGGIMKEFEECIKCKYRPETCVDCEAMYRGEPAKEDEGQEYVVLTPFGVSDVVKTDISPQIFKDIFKTIGSSYAFTKDYIIRYNHKLYKYCSEFEKYGFMEKVVHDPVVKINDCFKRNDGYKFMIVSAGSGRAILTGIDNNAVYRRNDIFCIGDKLSDFVGDTVKDFKPVKIKITEVEEG